MEWVLRPNSPTIGLSTVPVEGQWFKMATVRTGFHKVDVNLISSLGLDPQQVNPNQVNLYGMAGMHCPSTMRPPAIGFGAASPLKWWTMATTSSMETTISFSWATVRRHGITMRSPGNGATH